MLGRPATEDYSEKLAVMVGCSWLLLRRPRCPETSVAAAETNSLAVVLLSDQRNQRILEVTE
jgi:hypothetical protein